METLQDRRRRADQAVRLQLQQEVHKKDQESRWAGSEVRATFITEVVIEVAAVSHQSVLSASILCSGYKYKSACSYILDSPMTGCKNILSADESGIIQLGRLKQRG